jgi:hypothetical protein
MEGAKGTQRERELSKRVRRSRAWQARLLWAGSTRRGYSLREAQGEHENTRGVVGPRSNCADLGASGCGAVDQWADANPDAAAGPSGSTLRSQEPGLKIQWQVGYLASHAHLVLA